MNFDTLKYSKGDVVEIENNFNKKMNYVIISISKSSKFIKLLPLSNFRDVDELSENRPFPLSMPFSMIKKIDKIDKSLLLFYLDTKNNKFGSILKKYLRV